MVYAQVDSRVAQSRMLTCTLWILTALFITGFSCTVQAQSVSGLADQFEEAKRLYYFDEHNRSRGLFEEITPALCDKPELAEECAGAYLFQSVFNRLDRDFSTAGHFIEKANQVIDQYMSEGNDLLVEVYVQHAYLADAATDLEKADIWSSTAVEYVETYPVDNISRSRAYVSKGYVEDSKGNYQEAVDSYSKALDAITNEADSFELNRMLSIVHNNIGVSYRRLGMYDEAMNHYQQALEAAKKTYGDYHGEIALIYNSIGTFYYSTGDLGTAAEYFLQAAGIFKEVMGENSGRLAITYNNIGLIYIQLDDLDNATHYLELAQRIKENIFGPEHLDTAVGYHNLASNYLKNEEYAAAEKNYLLSLEVRKKIYGTDHPNLILPYTNIANLYIQTERYSAAREELQKALQIGLNRLGESHPDVLSIYSQFGETHKKENRLNEAEQFYRKAISILIGEPYDPQDTSIDVNSVDYPVRLIDIIKAKTELNIEQYNQNGESQKIYEVLRLMEAASETVDLLQTQYQSEASKIRLVEDNYFIYAVAVDLLYELYHQTGERVWLEELVEFAEKGRSRIALELLQNVRARNFGGVPADVLARERELNEKVTNHFQNLHIEQDKGLDADEELIRSYEDSLFSSRRDLLGFTESLEESYPSYYALKYDRNIATAEDIQKLLQSDETAILYVYGKEKLYGVVINRSGIDIEILGETGAISEDVNVVNHSVTGNRKHEYATKALELYQTLIEPIEPHIDGNSLIILPDQTLHYLPFEMLINEPVEGLSYHQYSYLLKKYKIQYAPSATVFTAMQNQSPENPRNFLAFAPFNETTGMAATPDETAGMERYFTDLPPLPLSSYETDQISELFKKRRTFRDYFFTEQTSVYKDRDATKNRLYRPSVKDYGFIHFATHAFVNESSPELSGIALRGEDGGDGILYLSDIYNLQMNADLVVLGACETGLGTMHKGEGIIGFTRAFIYAGVSNLVVSMWRVNDQPTSRLMIDFYKNIRKEMTYGESLQKAKLKLVQNPETANPIHWAAFVLNGR